MAALLEAVNLVKTYGGRRVVDEVCFHVGEGEIVGLLGPNGAGKTTSFRMVIGMITPNAGAVHFQDEDVSMLPMYKRARRGMGYLSQEPSIFQLMTVEDNVLCILEALGVPNPERRHVTQETLEEFGIAMLHKQRANTLSGGERRRLEIARAMVTSPALILLDEPFSGVDPKAVADIQDIIVGLRKKGIGVLLTDHSVRETLSVTDRSYIIHEGHILKEGSPQEIVDDPEAKRTYLGDRFTMDFDAFQWNE